MKKILLYIYDLEKGGVATVAINWINYLSKYFQIDLLLHQDIIQYDIRNIKYNKLIILHQASNKRKHFKILKNFFVDTFRLNKIFMNYEYVVVNIDLYKHTIPIMLINKFFNRNPKYNLIGWIHACLDEVKYYPNQMIKNLHIQSLKSFKDIVCVSNVAKKSLLNYTKNNLINNDIIVIYNAIEKLEVRLRENKIKQLIKVLAIGRLCDKKGFDLLIKAVIKLHNTYNIELIICGGGVEKDNLQKLIDINNANDYIKLTGIVKDPALYYEQANIFISPSLSEALPTVIIEALLYSLPIITTNTGAAEILDYSDKYGIIIPINDINAIELALEKLILNPDIYAYYCENSYNVLNKFNPEIIYKKWLEIIY